MKTMTEASLAPFAESCPEETRISFEEGIIGVPRARSFVLLEREGSAVRVLRSLDIEGFALPVTDPRLADPGYRPSFSPRLAESLDAGPADPIVVLAVTTLGPEGATANLRAPVVLNPRNGRAAQVILDDRRYPLNAPVPLAE